MLARAAPCAANWFGDRQTGPSLLRYGSEEQKQRYIPKLASGEWIGSWALIEPESGSTAGGTNAREVREGDCWEINGGKTSTTNGKVADLYVVLAVTIGAASSHGMAAYLVETAPPGF